VQARKPRRWLPARGRPLVAAAVVCAAAWAAAGAATGARERDGRLADLTPGRWHEIHRQAPGDAEVFVRQAHAGSAFDSRRGRIVLFGSDTHGRDWTNSPLSFDVARRLWRRAYRDDPPSSYRVAPEGHPVAGPEGDRPWAMHTFGAVTYDAAHDRLVVASYPEHLTPGRFTDAMARVWPGIRRHPTWLFDLAAERWRPLSSEPVHFFPYATAYDSHRATVVGYRRDGVYELALGESEPAWRRVADASRGGYHTSAVYDTRRRVVVVVGDHRLGDEVVVYDPATRRDRVPPTPGRRPPPFQHAPTAWHESRGLVVVLVDERRPGGAPGRSDVRAATWLYDPGRDAWSRLDGAELAGPVGMNYNLHHDPLHDVLLLVTGHAGAPTSVWALRLP